MKIPLPHLGYSVYIEDITKYNGKGKDKTFLENAEMFVESLDDHSSIMWITYPVEKEDIPTIAHETVHVLNNICKARLMTFENEEEHMAYIMQYILNAIIGRNYWKK